MNGRSQACAQSITLEQVAEIFATADLSLRPLSAVAPRTIHVFPNVVVRR